MICNQCGAVIREAADFCRSCGAAKPKSFSPKQQWLILIPCVLLLLSGVAVVFAGSTWDSIWIISLAAVLFLCRKGALTQFSTVCWLFGGYRLLFAIVDPIVLWARTVGKDVVGTPSAEALGKLLKFDPSATWEFGLCVLLFLSGFFFASNGKKLRFLPAIVWPIFAINMLASNVTALIKFVNYTPFNSFQQFVIAFSQSVLPAVADFLWIWFPIFLHLALSASKVKKEKKGFSAIGDLSLNLDEVGYINIGKHIILSLVTFGIWNLIWVYRTTAYLNRTPKAEKFNPINKTLLYLFVPFYSIYWYYVHGQRTDKFARAKRLSVSDIGTLCLVLGILFPLAASVILQERINAIATAPEVLHEAEQPQVAPVQPTIPQPATQPTVSSDAETIESLKKYKELLDLGVITQEDFDQKKKQLLKL